MLVQGVPSQKYALLCRHVRPAKAPVHTDVRAIWPVRHDCAATVVELHFSGLTTLLQYQVLIFQKETCSMGSASCNMVLHLRLISSPQ